MAIELKPGYVWFEVVNGPEGPSLNIGDDSSGYRLAGPKPWGGGKVVHRFMVKASELLRELPAYTAPQRAGGDNADR